MLKQITYKLLLFGAVCVVINYLYAFTLYNHDIKKNATNIYQCLNLKKGVHVLYLGESSNMTFGKDDSTQKTISELLAQFTPELNHLTIDTFAVHSGIYKYWIKNLKNHKPKSIIVTMNLRSFGAAWIHSPLENKIQKTVIAGKTPFVAINRLLMSLKLPSEKTDKEREQDVLSAWKTDEFKFPYPFKHKNVRQWDDAMANGGWLKADGSWDFEKIELACHYIKGYAFSVDEKNPRVKDFDEIAEWGKNNNVKIYFNLLAENVETADSLVKKDLVFLMKQNRDFLVKRYSKKGATVIDNLEIVPAECFLDKKWTTEHYNDKGRIMIAKNIAKNITIN
ncbi:MAG: hypothetical protein KA163_01000 [Bacteroidia bacterium]|nr:hypothetical protein [Bacteroidia bacterium]